MNSVSMSAVKCHVRLTSVLVAIKTLVLYPNSQRFNKKIKTSILQRIKITYVIVYAYLYSVRRNKAATMSKRGPNLNIPASVIAKKPKHWSLGLLDSMNDPESVVRRSKHCVVIKDKYPKAKIHYLVLPQDDINSIYKLNSSHTNLLEEFGQLFKEIQNEEAVTLKAGFHAVPSMQRLHMHIISTDMISPGLKTKIHWNSFTTSFFRPYEDVLHELKENGSIKKISPELHKSLMSTELQCNQCSHKPKNMPQLKEHLLTHIKS